MLYQPMRRPQSMYLICDALTACVCVWVCVCVCVGGWGPRTQRTVRGIIKAIEAITDVLRTAIAVAATHVRALCLGPGRENCYKQKSQLLNAIY